MRLASNLAVIVVAFVLGIGNAFAPPPIIVIGTGTGGKIAVTVGTPITNGESSNRLNVAVTNVIGSFVVYEGATGPTHSDTTGLSIRAGGVEKARITRAGSQFEWLIADGDGNLVSPQVCEFVNTTDTIPDCSQGSAGIPARIIDLSSGVTLWATWGGQSAWVQIDHVTLQGASQ
jgi:hypothetical protein